MIVLGQPSPSADDQHLAELCTRPHFSSLATKWSEAYKKYRDHKGDPWQITHTAFSEPTGVLQGALYDSQNQSQRIKAIRNISLASCPMCGSPVTGTLDHYLPRENFPEFSVMAANLIPACTHCNSGKKRRIFKGSSIDERFLHPYFDTIAMFPIWFIKVLPPYRAATFQPRVLPTVTGTSAKTVAFHLENVLGTQFRRSVERRWATLPEIIRNNAKQSGALSPSELKTFLAERSRDATVSCGQNSWETAFFRGLEIDNTVQAYVLGVIPP